MPASCRSTSRETDIAALVAASVEGLRDRLSEQQIALEIRRAARISARFHVDAQRVRQILFNLVSNAIRFSNAGGHIRRGGEAAGTLVVFTVADDGVGIPEGLMPGDLPAVRDACRAGAARRRRARPFDREEPGRAAWRRGRDHVRGRRRARPRSCACRSCRPPSPSPPSSMPEPAAEARTSLRLPDETGDGAPRRGHRRGAEARRPCRAFRRARRRKDDVCPRAAPRACRRSGARSAEPDLSAPPRPRAAAAEGRARRPLSACGRAASSTRSAWTRRLAKARCWSNGRSACRMDLSDERLDIAFELDGDGRRAEIVGRRHLAGAARGAASESALSSIAAGTLRRDRGALSARPATPPTAPMSGSPAGGGDASILMNAPARIEGPPIYCRPLLRRGGASRDGCARLSSRSIWRCARPASARRRFSPPTWITGCCCWRISAARGSSTPPARRSSSATKRRSISSSYMHGRDWPAEDPAAGRRTSTASRPTTATRCSSKYRSFPDWFGGQAASPPSRRSGARHFWRPGRRCSTRLEQPIHDLDAPRFPFAEHSLAGGGERARPRRRHRFPGRADRASRL